jgi:hypothetical protein
MKFEQPKAGNAEGRHASRLGIAAVLHSAHMAPRSRIRIVLVALCALALFAAPARASDPLLSGYGGPGSGEQTLLGGGTVGGSGSSGSGSGGAGAQQSLRATTPAPTASATGAASSDTGTTPTRKPSRKGSSSPSSGQAMNGSKTSSGSSSTASGSSPATRPGAPRAVAYPTRAGEVGGLPLSLGQALLVVLGVAALILAVLGLRRLTGGPGDPPPMTQASAR